MASYCCGSAQEACPPRRPASVGLLFMSARRRLTERITGLDQVEQSYSLSSRVLGLSLAIGLYLAWANDVHTGLYEFVK